LIAAIGGTAVENTGWLVSKLNKTLHKTKTPVLTAVHSVGGDGYSNTADCGAHNKQPCRLLTISSVLVVRLLCMFRLMAKQTHFLSLFLQIEGVTLLYPDEVVNQFRRRGRRP